MVMPSKSVRFSSMATLQTYTPDTAYSSLSSDSTRSSSTLSPSSYSSGSTLFSSAGPFTPPSAYTRHLPHQYHPYPSHPYGYKPFYMPQPQPPRLHRMLESGRYLRYDFTLSPTNAVMGDRHPFSGEQLSEFAVFPPTQYLEITCRYLPLPIPVRSSHYVTIDDILYTIYKNMRKNLSEAEFKAIRSSSTQGRITEAYRRRYRSVPHSGAYEAEKRGGLKKVDLLMENKWFSGLKSTNDPNRWNLEVSAYS